MRGWSIDRARERMVRVDAFTYGQARRALTGALRSESARRQLAVPHGCVGAHISATTRVATRA